MKKTAYILLTTFALAVFATGALAQAETYRLRDMADSEYRMATKAYNAAVKQYGESLDGMPADEKASVCKQIGYALHDNKVRYRMEDIFAQPKYKRQVQRLEEYSRTVGCSN